MSDSSINLVSEEIQKSRLGKEKESKIKLFSIATIIFSSIALVGVLSLFLWSEKRLSLLKEEKSFLESRIKANKEVEQLVLGIKERSEVFNSLYSSRQLYSAIIMEISDLLPQEVVLTSLSFNDNSVDLVGKTTSYSALARFIEEGNENIKQKNIHFPFELISLKQAGLDSETGKIVFTLSLEFPRKEKPKLEKKAQNEKI